MANILSAYSFLVMRFLAIHAGIVEVVSLPWHQWLQHVRNIWRDIAHKLTHMAWGSPAAKCF